MPAPNFCPSCRMQRRMTFRNERHLCQRNCDLCGETTISMYSPDKPFTVYCQDCWWSDKWDAQDFSQDFDFDKTFSEQFQELHRKTPKIAAMNVNRENSEYCNITGDVKNCYLIFGSVYSEDCMYGSPYYSKDCLDTLVVRECELCYECTDCRKLYNCMFCHDCVNSSDLLHCYDLQGCQECIGCAGLRNKKFCIYNEQYSEEEYKKFKAKVDLCDSKTMQALQEKAHEMKMKSPRRFMQMAQVENVSGDHIYNSKNIQNSFFTDKSEDCAYCAQVVDLKDCYDNNYTEENELCYDYLGMYANKNVCFSLFCRHAYNVLFSDYCVNVKNLFGCSNMKNAEYCILNKQYTKEEYEKLLPRIIEHLKSTGEWGEFFPSNIAPFGYNETVAQEYFPLTRDEALAKNFVWSDYESPAPEAEKTIKCEVTDKPFRILQPELKFYKKLSLPIPSKHPDVRHQERLALRNPRKLWKRSCSKCNTEITTSYSPDRKELVYCEDCYLAEVY